MYETIDVEWEYTNKLTTAKQWLDELPDLFAADFETAIKYTDDQIAFYKTQAENKYLSKALRISYNSRAEATALDHPSHTTLTHLSIASSPTKGRVIVLDTDAIKTLILKFLIETDKTQIWHNASYDFRQIQYRTWQFPKNYEDTQILAKTLLNHTNNQKSLTGLKHLAGHAYGDWGLSSEVFSINNIYDLKLIKYAAIDACATYWVWEKLQAFIKESNNAN